MTYNDLKLKLIRFKLILEKTTEKECSKLGLDKRQVEKDIIQYVIFIEELESLLKKDKTRKMSEYNKQLNLINHYLDVLDKKIKKA